MTVSSTSARQTYIGDGSTALYSYNFRIFVAAELALVKRNTTTGVETVLVNGVDFSVTGAGSYSGGTFTLNAGVLPAGFTLAAYRLLDLLQNTDLRNQGSYLAEVHERVFDRLLMIAQQLQDQLNRAVRLPDSEAGGALLKLPTKELRALQQLAFDVNGNPIAAGSANAAVSVAMQPVVAAADLAAARALAGGLIPTVATIAALKALTETNLAAYVQVAGYLSAGDGGGGLFRWVAADVTADNGGTVIMPTAGGGRFFRIFSDALNVRWFGAIGDGVATETTLVSAAITAAAAARRPLIFPATSNSYRVGPLTIPSNSRLTFETGCTLRAISGYGLNERMLSFDGASDVVVEAYGATFQMEKAEYVSGEQRHVFYLINCTRVQILGGTAKESGGDGYYISGATDCRVVDVTADNNRRNGMSIIKANGLRVVRPVLKNTIGTSPEAGLDIEPNGPTDALRDIVIDSPQSIDNAGAGFQIYLDSYKAGSPADVEITINNPVSRSNAGYGYRIRNIFLNAGSYGGAITISNPVSIEDAWHGLSILNKGKDAPLLKVVNPVLIDCCLADQASPNYAGVYISDDSACVSGEIHIENLSVKVDHAGMDYGVFLESGQGFSGLRVTMADVKGAQVQPVRWNNLTSTIADASDALVDVSRLRGTTPRTSGINVDGDYAGTVFTNVGAVGAVTFVLRHYLPAGNRYRFRVEAAFALTIDTSDAADRIVGTTVPGATVACSTIGEEADLYYLGTFGGVRYWRIDILGKQTNWTFS